MDPFSLGIADHARRELGAQRKLELRMLAIDGVVIDPIRAAPHGAQIRSGGFADPAASPPQPSVLPRPRMAEGVRKGGLERQNA